MRTTVLVAVPHAGEPALVDAIAECGELELVRRCADLPELLSVAAAGLGAAALVGAGLPGLDRGAVAHLGRCGVHVVGVARPGHEADERRLRGLGLVSVLPADVDPQRLAAVLRGAGDPLAEDLAAQLGVAQPQRVDPQRVDPQRVDPQRDGDRGDGDRGDGDRGDGDRDDDDQGAERFGDDRLAADEEPGRVIAVWGPTGAPGRSTVALGLASEAAHSGVSALLVDADPYGGVQALALALLDEAAGLAGALRSADQGTLDVAGLRHRCLQVAPGLAVLTGLPRADRWPELRPDALEALLLLARRVADVVVVDCGFSLEDDEELSYDTTAPRRNAATLTTLACADHLVVVGAGEPIGLQRLVRGLQELGTVRTPPARTVVVNRLRESAVGPRPEASVAAALERFAGVADVCFIPDDRPSFDRAVLQGRTLVECAPRSPARLALADLTARLLGRPQPRRRAQRARRTRRTTRPRH